MGETEKDILLQKWLRGEIGPEEESRLFALAKDDPFLAEALEGFLAFPEGDATAATDRIRARLPQPASGRRFVLLVWMPRVAAAVLLLAVTGWAFWYINTPATPDLAEKTSTENISEPAEPAQPITDSLLAMEEAEEEKSTELRTSLPDENRQGKDEARKPAVAPKPLKLEKSSASTSGQDRLAEDIKTQKEDKAPEIPPQLATAEPAPAAAPPPAAYEGGLPQEDAAIAAEEAENQKLQEARVRRLGQAAKSRRAEAEVEADAVADIPNAFVVSGMVLDEAGEPLIGANVLAEGSDRGTVTDFNGAFQLDVPGSVATLVIQFIGYEEAAIEIPPYSDLEIRLSESSQALSEVTVTGFSKKADVADADEAEPKGGFRKFEKYLKKNQQYPEEAEQNGIRGEVVLSFTINAQGRPTNIRVEQSLGFSCDEEAIRLLQEGPAWKPGSTPAPVTYPMSFPLE